jgi:Fe-S-cluster containining protein
MKASDLPEMRCDEGCGECCGPSFASNKEYQEIIRYMREHHVVPKKNDGLRCPLYQDGKCQVYPVRPVLCQIFGHTERLPCVRGYNENLPDKQIKKFFKENIAQPHPLFALLFEKELHEKA